ncbi:MAG: GNAT family N-acetyltransferase, partial [Methyloligellaceae bacterium]
NPIDIIGDAGPERYEAALHAVLDDADGDAVLVMNCPTALTSSMAAAETVLKVVRDREAAKRPLKPILTNWLGADGAEHARDLFADAGIPTYETPADSVRGFNYLTRYRTAQRELMRTPPSLPRDFSVDAAAAHRAMQPAATSKRALLTEPEAKAVLAAYGIPTVATEIASSPEEVRQLAGKFLKREPAVAVKILSEDISHKTDVGGVRLDLTSAEVAGDVAEAMSARIAKAQPEAQIQGFTVQPMVIRPGAHELIVGVAEDDIFGPVILFGAGGTAVEVMDDKAVGLPPLDLLLARDLMAETRIARLLEGHRGIAGADLDAIAMTLVRISQLIVDCPEIRELDINPLLADAAGVIALDARIRVDVSGAPAAKSRERFAIRPYPSEWETEVDLKSDGPLRIRPIRPTDEHYYGAFFDNLEPEDIRFRLFMPKKALSHAFIARFTQIDYARAMAFVAFDEDEEMLCGVARFAADPDYRRAEFAIIVRSDLKGKGIGGALMQHLIAYARSEGLQELFGSVLRENTTMLRMCADFGFEVVPDPDDASLRKVVLRLADGA